MQPGQAAGSIDSGATATPPVHPTGPGGPAAATTPSGAGVGAGKGADTAAATGEDDPSLQEARKACEHLSAEPERAECLQLHRQRSQEPQR